MEQENTTRNSEPRPEKTSRWGFRGMTVRNWLELLIVPLVLAGIGFWFSAQQDTRQRELEDQRAQDAALQAYLDQMGTLLLEENLRASAEDSEPRTLAKARTSTILERIGRSTQTQSLRLLEGRRVD